MRVLPVLLATFATDTSITFASMRPAVEDRTRHASLAGKPNAEPPGLVEATIARLPEGAEIVAAFDADEVKGRKTENSK